MNITDELLMAYADGELDETTSAAVSEAIFRDPTLAARIEEHRALRAQLQSAFDPIVDEPVPDRLLTVARASPPAHQSPVADLTEARQRRANVPTAPWSFVQWSAIAASLLVGLLIGHLALNTNERLRMREGRLIAAGALATALNEQLSSDARADTTIALSFRDKEGAYCRTFTIAAKQTLAGLACRTGGDWRLHAVMEVPGAGAGYRMASSALPAGLRDAVEHSMQGEPLTPAQESAARDRDWR